jgi:hypothetical protein
LIYTFGKQRLTPRNRIGFIAYSPLMEEKEKEILKEGMRLTSYISYSFPCNTFQHSLHETIDFLLIWILSKRNRIYESLMEIGYECPVKP